jgi:hypothetical protein
VFSATSFALSSPRLNSREQLWQACESEKHKRRHSGHFTRLIGDSSFGDYLDLFKFRFFKAKESCHIGDLIRAYEVRGLRTESFYTGGKVAALHCFRDVQANAAGAFRGAKHAEVTDNHFHFPSDGELFVSNVAFFARPRFAPRLK